MFRVLVIIGVMIIIIPGLGGCGNSGSGARSAGGDDTSIGDGSNVGQVNALDETGPDNEAPTAAAMLVASLLPATVSSGEKIRISGSYLLNATVRVADLAPQIDLHTDNVIELRVPELTEGSYELRLERDESVISRSIVVQPSFKATQLDVGAKGSCAVGESGRVACWWPGQYLARLAPVDNARLVSSGVGTSCAITTDDTLQCWSLGSNTLIEDSDLTDGESTATGKLVNPIALSLGPNHKCVVQGNGDVLCSGLNTYGQVNGDLFSLGRNFNNFVITGPQNAIAVAVSDKYSCALTDVGKVWCWGDVNDSLDSYMLLDNAPDLVYDYYGLSSPDLGTISQLTELHPEHQSDGASVLSVGVGTNCVIADSAEVECWNKAEQWQNTISNAVSIEPPTNRDVCAVRESGHIECASRYAGIDNRVMPGISNAVSIDRAGNETCILQNTGEVRCWSDVDRLHATTISYIPYFWHYPSARTHSAVTAADLDAITSVSAFSDGTCFGFADGSMNCLHSFDFASHQIFPRFDGSVRLRSVSWGPSASCVLLLGGQIKCWGSNHDGLLGQDDAISSSAEPLTIPGIDDASEVVMGQHVGCALRSAGSIACWGTNIYGLLGNRGYWKNITPLDVTGIDSARSLVRGSHHYCALLASGKVACWGRNNRGQLGTDTAGRSSPEPLIVAGLGKAVAVVAENFYSCALLESGSVSCWGENDKGQLGNGSTVNSATPVAVEILANVTSLATAENYACAQTVKGEVYCWGDNQYGQLGNGSTDMSNMPVKVIGIGNSVRISVGVDHSCALLESAEVQCWGANQYGQLGDGSYHSSASPVSVNAVVNVVDISVGDRHSCAVLSNGRMQCWGDNSTHQLGVDIPPAYDSIRPPLKLAQPASGDG